MMGLFVCFCLLYSLRLCGHSPVLLLRLLSARGRSSSEASGDLEQTHTCGEASFLPGMGRVPPPRAVQHLALPAEWGLAKQG